MEKFGVATNDVSFKTAAASGRSCPQCGSTQVDYRTMTPFCPNCGTEPWEIRNGQEAPAKESRR